MPGAGDATRQAEQEGSGPAPRGDQPESLIREVGIAADAAVAHARKVAATATAEARLTVASAAGIAAAVVSALVLLVVTWICLLALGIWLAVQAGLPVWAALTGAVLLNLAGALICRLWYARLTPDLGFARTRSLLRR